MKITYDNNRPILTPENEKEQFISNIILTTNNFIAFRLYAACDPKIEEIKLREKDMIAAIEELSNSPILTALMLSESDPEEHRKLPTG